MEIVIATISILVITALIWVLNKFLPFKVCPICAGVSGTWLWMLIGMLAHQLPVINYQLPVAILMGGSVVGIAYQVEKHPAFAKAMAGKPLLWKILFLPTGFITVYGVLSGYWFIFFAAVLVMAALTLTFLGWPRSGKKVSQKVEELKEKMKQCC